MPPLPVIAGVVRCTLNWTHASAPPMHNVLHFEGQSGTEHDRCDDFIAQLAAGTLDTISNQYELSSIDFLPLDGTSPSVPGIPTTPAGGGGGGEFDPGNSAILSLHSAYRGPANRGRVFLPALSENATANGFLDDPTALATAWATTLANFDGSTPMGNWAIASYKVPSAVAVVSISVPGVIGTQRGRLVRLR